MSGCEDTLRQRTSKLHLFAIQRYPRLKITLHARERMLERKISEIDIRSILKTGNVVKVEQQGQEEKWNVRGETDDRREIEVVIAPQDAFIRVTLITTWERRIPK